MDVFTLSRNWFNFSFENPEKIKPNHTALYFFCIEHCNRLGGKEKFGLPTTMAKEAIGISSYNTYINTLNDLVVWGFIKMIEKSKNQYSSNIIALSNFNKALDKALDKAMIKHGIKHGIKQSESIDSIDIQIYNNTNIQGYNNTNTQYDFDFFWNLYDKKIGDKEKLKIKWNNFSLDIRKKIIDYIPAYKKSQPDKKYRKNISTFFNQKSWNDEILEIENKDTKKINNYEL